MECKNYQDVLIDEVFDKACYECFRVYCADKGLLNFKQLEGFDFDALLSIKGFNNTNVAQLKKRYAKVSSKLALDVNNVSSIKNNDGKSGSDNAFCDVVNTQLAEIDIDILTNFSVTHGIIDTLKEKNIKLLGELGATLNSNLGLWLNKKQMDNLKQVKTLLSLNFVEFFELILEQKSQDNSYTMMLMRAQGYTLEEIGQYADGVTRERVRQILDKFVKAFAPLTRVLGQYFTRDKNYVTVQELIDIYDNDDYDEIILMLFKSSKEKWEYLDFAGVFVPVREGTTTESIIVDLVKNFVGDGMFLSEKGEDFCSFMESEGFPYMDIQALRNFALTHKYKLFKDFITSSRAGYAELCEIIVAREFPNGIKLHEDGIEDLNLLREKALEYYGDIGLPEKTRTFSAQLDRVLYLCGRGRFTAADNIVVDMDVMEQIKTYIDNAAVTEIPYVEIFEIFKDKLEKSGNINSRYALQGAFQLYYPEDYKYTRDVIIKNAGLGISYGLKERLQQFLLNAQRPVSKYELQVAFKGVSPIMFMRAINDSPDVIQWKDNYYMSLRLLKTGNVNIIKVLDDIIDQQIKNNDGFTSANLLWNEVKNRLAKFVEDNEMTDGVNVFYIAQALLKDKFDFRFPNIAQKGIIENLSSFNIVRKFFADKDIFTIGDYKELAQKMAWAIGSYYGGLEQILKSYVRISAEDYMIAEKFKVSQECVENIEKVIEAHMDNGYLVLDKFTEWTELPDIGGFEWNAFLLRSILDKYSREIKIVEPSMIDRRYEKGIAIPKNMDVDSYVEAVAKILYSRGYRELGESMMYRVLHNLGLAWKVIPLELYNGETIRFVKNKNGGSFILKV